MPFSYLGHEFPFAIKMNHMREAALTDEDGFPFDFDQQLPMMDPLSPETQCQFILKRNRKIPNRIAIGKLICFRLNQRGVDRSPKENKNKSIYLNVMVFSTSVLIRGTINDETNIVI